MAKARGGKKKRAFAVLMQVLFFRDMRNLNNHTDTLTNRNS